MCVHIRSVAADSVTLGSTPDSSVHEILQARILGWTAISSSRGSSQPRDRTLFPGPPALQADSSPLSHQVGVADGTKKEVSEQREITS